MDEEYQDSLFDGYDPEDEKCFNVLDQHGVNIAVVPILLATTSGVSRT